MIPLQDLTPRRSFPTVTLLLIVANTLVFLYQISQPPHAAEAFIMTYGVVPYKIQMALQGHHYTLQEALLPLFTCMFLHGGWLHIIGNMWFLWIFGANVEDRMGPVAYLLFYLVCGIGSSIAQTLFSWGSHIPSLGASGAISGAHHQKMMVIRSPALSITTWASQRRFSRFLTATPQAERPSSPMPTLTT